MCDEELEVLLLTIFRVSGTCLYLSLCTLNSFWPDPAARISSLSRGGSSAFYSRQTGLVLMTAVGEASNLLDCWAILAVCLNVGQEGRVEVLAFSFQTEKAQSDIVGGTLVSETFSVSSHTGPNIPLLVGCVWWVPFRNASARAVWPGVQGTILVGGADRQTGWLTESVSQPATCWPCSGAL